MSDSTCACSFCGAAQALDTPLIAGIDGHICESCVVLAGQVVGSWGRKRALDRPLLKYLLGSALALDDAGWRRLTLRWAVFFAFMAGANEAVWRTQTTDVWVTFKVFGILGLTFVFALAQTPLVLKHRLPEGQMDENGGGS